MLQALLFSISSEQQITTPLRTPIKQVGGPHSQLQETKQSSPQKEFRNITRFIKAAAPKQIQSLSKVATTN